MIHTTEVIEVDDELVAAFERLTPQLSSSSPAPGADELAAIVASPATVLFIARDIDSGEILGSLTLALFRIPTGMRAWIEDVVVDEAQRGRGVGNALNQAALDRARAEGAKRCWPNGRGAVPRPRPRVGRYRTAASGVGQTHLDFPRQ